MESINSRFISLKHLFINDQKQIGIKHQPDRVIDAMLKDIPGVEWSSQFGMYFLKNNPHNLDLLMNKFKGITWVDCRSFFPNKPVNIYNDAPDISYYRKRKLPQGYRPCPDEYYDKL